MRRYSLHILVILQCFLGFGQDIKAELPNIIAPSPTVAALMKFEEVPVSNYTGIPDISIPLFSTNTLSKDIALNISLNYHPSGVAADERSSDVGLGWSLFAGGTISRTVRGLPDEIYQTGAVLPGGFRFGIYQSATPYGNNDNTYYDAFEDIRLYYDVNPDSVSEAGFDRIDKCLWNNLARGEMDAEHDLWQFNFMGKSGRFYIKKNSSNVLEVVPLDDYRIKIENTYGHSSNAYMPTSFTIYDEKGYKYIFDVIEKTSIHPFSSSNPAIALWESPASASASYSYNSSFHLKEIRDNNNNVIVSFDYNTNSMIEKVIDGALTYYQEEYDEVALSILDFYLLGPCGQSVQGYAPYPKSSSSANQKETTTKKLKLIEVTGIAKIDFHFEDDRHDENFLNSGDLYSFKGISVRNWVGDSIKKVELTHDYSVTKIARMILSKVSFQNFTDTKEENYELFYKSALTSLDITKDYWGYFNLKNPLHVGGSYRETSPQFCTVETLQKMKLPTGGCIIYDFEPNTYSFIGSAALTDFDGNPDNWDDDVNGTTFGTSTTTSTTAMQYYSANPATDSVFLFSIADDQDVFFTSNINADDNIGEYWYKFYRKVDSTYILEGSFRTEGTLTHDLSSDVFRINNLPAGDYYVTLFSTTIPPPVVFNTAQIYAYYKIRNENDYKYLYGGGNRISKIGFFTDGSTNQDFYESSPTLTPEKEKRYVYDLFADNNKSSGSLTYNVPKFDYRRYKRECTYCTAGPSVLAKNERYMYYDVSTTFNNLSPVKTQGADVGYRNVKVYEHGNGYAKYEYTSPITHPEAIGPLNLSPPFLPTENFDYKRGLLTKEQLYDQTDRLLNEVSYEYELENYLEITGFKAFYPIHDFVNVYNDKYYENYKYYIERCEQYGNAYGCNDRLLTSDGNGDCDCFCYSGTPRDFMDVRMVKEAYGWAKLTSKTTENYFYPTSTPDIVQTIETFTYNAVNKQLAEHFTTNSKGETLATRYYYHTGDSVYSQNRISEISHIEQYNGTDLLSTSKIKYSDTLPGNVSYLPNEIQTAKGTDPLENRIVYSAYDEYGHPLEVKKQDGTVISYIWGYNKSQPIAKIENATNAQIATKLGVSYATVDESDLTAINLLRTDLPETMITTYTYIPLVGVSTVTDPRGYTTHYEYDSFGRLSMVKDADGKKLAENAYNYRTQN